MRNFRLKSKQIKLTANENFCLTFNNECCFIDFLLAKFFVLENYDSNI
ncbi:hypothetical protein BG20_I0963 [Candidatus Nitrosarchaeum limnium BG20]|uniref:Uncharacterized protein n=1 Tax=Candidatus Nitrosarchaeum limnium BG20 TaxID=859192 RepID=S2E580_9ARCH|nr:hypothetical protein BG20_I0963 [Candidatus Nitrosarchaeum limnium BG20]